MLQLSSLSDNSQPATQVAPLAPWDEFSPDDFLLTVKGAPEVILPRCTHVLDPMGGSPISITAPIRERIAVVQEQWSRQGQRVILLARKVVRDPYLSKMATRQTDQFGDAVEEHAHHLIVVGLVGLIDPLKDDIKETVRYAPMFLRIPFYSLLSGCAVGLVSGSSS